MIQSLSGVVNKDDFNLYAYVGNDPLNKIDPSGLAPGDPFESPEAAADDVIRFVNPTSIQNNVEHAGYIYRKNDAYYASLP